jgi:RNA polymerase sigma-70 factor (ECF subfamily)
MSDVAERDLIEKAKEDPEAFGELYRRYVDRIYNYLYRHTGNRSDAEDLTSRTFYRALRSLGGYRHQKGTFQAWLFRIAHNLMANFHRDHSRHPTVPIDVLPPLHSEQGNPREYLMATEEQQRLRKIIDMLPEDRKALIMLKFVEQMTNAEIAEVLGKTEGAVKALYYRTLRHLQRVMVVEVKEDET